MHEFVSESASGNRTQRPLDLKSSGDLIKRIIDSEIIDIDKKIWH